MAKIFPERLPESITSDPRRQAECKVYAALKTLPDRYNVFYSVHWETIDRERGAVEGEADFVIAHPDMGIVILEVKGGGIRYDSATDQWYSYEVISGTPHLIKDPVGQASRNKYALLDELKALPGWPAGYINIGHAVCFPDTYCHNQRLRPDLPREMVIDRQDMDDIRNAVDRLFRSLFGEHMGSGAPGGQRLRMLEGYLARSFELRTPLGVELDYEDEKLVQLTEQQFAALSLLGDRRRVAIGGCAGSGKTMFAIEKARQFHDLGLSVLLVCFNIPLAEYLKRLLPDIDVYHFHGLCHAAIQQVGARPPIAADEHELYDTILPGALLDAAAEIGRVYDAIIVDEGQDFLETYWIALEPLLRETGYLFVFFDDNQNLYGGAPDFGGLVAEAPFVLDRNCRNTQSIHNLVARFHNHPDKLTCIGPPGRSPEVLTCQSEDDGLRQLQKLLHRLVVEEHIHPSDIAILTPRGREKTHLKPNLQLGSFRLLPQPSNERNVIQATSVHAFKGMEKRVIILTEIDARTPYNANMVFYVGCSRARTHLVILHDVDATEAILQRLQPGSAPT